RTPAQRTTAARSSRQAVSSSKALPDMTTRSAHSTPSPASCSGAPTCPLQASRPPPPIWSTVARPSSSPPVTPAPPTTPKAAYTSLSRYRKHQKKPQRAEALYVFHLIFDREVAYALVEYRGERDADID